MIKQILLIALLATVAISAKPKWYQLEGYTFDQYIEDFGKKYEKDSDLYNERKALFEEKLATIIAFNKENHSYKQGVNKLTDQTAPEIKRVTMGLNKEMKRNSPNSAFRLLKTKTVSNDPNATLPDHVDWREKGVVSPVKDQGGCGSCWAFSSAAVLESHAAIAAGAGQLKTLSTQQLVSCVPNPRQCGGQGGCDGAIPELAFSYVTLYGLTSEFKYSYTSYQGNTGKCTFNPKTQTPEVINEGYISLEANNQDALLQAIAFVGPVAVSVDASNWANYETGVFNGCSYDKNIDINHSVTLVGYGTDPKLGDYWLVRNSWGTEYGEDGYIRLKRDAKAECGMDKTPADGSACAGDDDTPIEVCGQCGILSDSAYPLKVQVIG